MEYSILLVHTERIPSADLRNCFQVPKGTLSFVA